MSEEEQKGRGGAARYLAMVACVLLGGFVYVGWRIKKGDELKQQHQLAADIQSNINEGLSLTIPKEDNPRVIKSNINDDDILSDLTIGSEQEETTIAVDTPDDIDIEALLASTQERDITQEENSIGGVSGNDLNILLPETEQVITPEVTPPPAPEPETFAQQQELSPSVNNDLFTTTPFSEEIRDNTQVIEKDSLTQAKDSPSIDSLANTTYRDYKVKRGDTLSKIAKIHLGSRKRAKEIFAINTDRMPNPNMLKVGMVLRIPFDRNSHRTSNHKISTTDSLPSIAMKYYGSAEPALIEGIRIANPILSRGGFQEGTRLIIPPLEEVQDTPVEIYANTPAGKERVYVVRAGDTLSRIAAKKYGNSNKWRAIFKANKNKIRKPSAIRAGMVLKLP